MPRAIANTIPTTGAVKFGLGQLFKPTPKTQKIIARTVLYVAALVVLILKVFGHHLPEVLNVSIQGWATEVAAFTHLVCRMFGIEEDSNSPI